MKMEQSWLVEDELNARKKREPRISPEAFDEVYSTPFLFRARST